MCKTNVKLQIISTNNFLDYVNNVDEPDDKHIWHVLVVVYCITTIPI